MALLKEKLFVKIVYLIKILIKTLFTSNKAN